LLGNSKHLLSWFSTDWLHVLVAWLAAWRVIDSATVVPSGEWFGMKVRRCTDLASHDDDARSSQGV